MPAFRFEPTRYPERPGCYIMKAEDGRVLYIGKSVNLRSRLRSYFRQPQKRRRLHQLVQEVRAVEVILVSNEAESLMLENHLIKLHKPPYNRALKRDNSGYAYLCLSPGPFPKLDVYYRDRRGAVNKAKAEGEAAAGGERTKAASAGPAAGEVRFGPFVSARFRDAVMAFVNGHYRLRTCGDPMPDKVCLQYHMGRCSGICERKVTEARYAEDVRQASAMLAGGGEKLIGAMYAAMAAYAEKLEFERAADMLHHIRLLEREPDAQAVDRESAHDQDVFYFGPAGGVFAANVRSGMLSAVGWFPCPGDKPEPADVFVARYYDDPAHAVPDEIVINDAEAAPAVRKALAGRAKRAVKVAVPKRGLKRDLLQICEMNYAYRTEAAAAAGDAER